MKTKGIAIALLVVAVVLLLLIYWRGPTIVERPVYINRYRDDIVPVYVQPSWWGSFGAPWAYDKPWKMGSGLPGMKVPPPPPPASQPPPPPPSQPAPPAQPPAK